MCYYVNNMKRIIPAILLLLALTGCYNSGEPRERVLKIYNWADYIGEGVLEDFQAYYKEQTGENIRIVYQTFDINEIMLTKIEKGHEDFDVVCPSEYIIERMLKKKLLLLLKKSCLLRSATCLQTNNQIKRSDLLVRRSAFFVFDFSRETKNRPKSV